jgi:hypothetical protein
MTATLSDWRALCLLAERGAGALGDYDLYKACVSFAINGRAHEAEARLGKEYRALLAARRALKSGAASEAERLLQGFDPKGERAPELRGDRDFLLGLLAHRGGNAALAEQRLGSAIEWYRLGADEHRTLRAVINQKICRSSLESFQAGELFFLKQRATAGGFFDLVGNIEKAAVNELLRSGEFSEAVAASLRALAAYEKDGCPEDRSVALALHAIALRLAGRPEDARRAEEGLRIRDGKVEPYVAILASLAAGERPELPPGHPLLGVDWNAMPGPKENSIPGRILQRLQAGSAERDDLIRSIWGPNAVHPSYAARLYTAIKDLRRKYKVPVEFDGASYRLAR